MARRFTTRDGNVGTAATRSEPCEICGHPDWCARFADGGVLCQRVESDTPCNGGGWLHWPRGRGDGWSPATTTLSPVRTLTPPRPTADADTCDAAYRALLAAAELSDEHRANLLRRGMSDAEISLGLYRTLPPETDRDELAAAAVAATQCDIVGAVPGFVRAADGGVRLVGVAGLLVPVMDAGGRVVGLRVRVDGETDGGKYRWVSAAAGGVGVDGHTCHVAYPHGRQAWRGWRSRRPVVAVTEGEIKAAIASRRLGIPVLSVPGVGNTGQVRETVMAVLGADGGETTPETVTVAIAYDADAGSNPHVAANEHRLARELTAAGYRVIRWEWDAADGKGLDDLLESGLLPTPTLYAAETDGGGDRPPTNPDETDRLRRRVDALETHLRRETDRADRNADTVRMVMAVLANKRMGAARLTLASAIVSLASRVDDAPETAPADGMHPVALAEIGTRVGVSPGTASRHLRIATEIPGSPLRRDVRLEERVDRETGEIRQFNLTYIGLAETVSNLTDFTAAAAVLETTRPRHGGSVTGRPRRVATCDEHPDAGVRVGWVATCRDCDRVVDTGTMDIAAETAAIAGGDSILESGIPVSGAFRTRSSLTRQDEITLDWFEPAADGGTLTLPGMPPLIPTGTFGHDKHTA